MLVSFDKMFQNKTTFSKIYKTLVSRFLHHEEPCPVDADAEGLHADCGVAEEVDSLQAPPAPLPGAGRGHGEHSDHFRGPVRRGGGREL